MKVGLVSRFPPEECGIGIYSENLAKALEKGKVQVVRIGSKGSKADYRISLRSPFLKRKLRKISRKEGLDLIHIQHIAPFFGKRFLNQNLIRALQQPVPVIVTLHEVHYPAWNLRTRVLQKIEEQVLRRASAVIVHSPLQKHYLNARGFKNVEHVCMGTSPIRIRPRKNKTLLCFGIMSREKGHKVLLDAMKDLPGHKLILAGKPIDRPYEKELVQHIQRLKLANVQADFGWVSDEQKDKYFRESSIMVLPYLWGPYTSAVVHDAVAYNMPTIITDVGSVGEVVDVYSIGKVVKPGSKDSIVAAVNEVQGKLKSYSTHLANYRKVASWQSVARLCKRIYEEVVQV